MTRLRLLVTDLEVGGTPRVVKELAIRLRPFGFDTAVACLAPWGPVADELHAAGVGVTAFGATRATQLPSVVRHVRTWAADADVVFSFLVHANVIAALASVPRLIQSIQTTQPRPAWHWWVQGWAGVTAERIVVPSASVVTAAVRRAGLPADRFVVIPNAIDPPPPAPRRRSDGGPWRVGFVGRLDPVKRVPDLVTAVARLPDTRLDLFGDGRDRPAIAAAIDRLHSSDRVTLHGTVASADAVWPRIDVLVLPSDAEGFGMVLIEAMAAGVPVVATDVAGIRDVVRDGQNGLLVSPRDPAALAAAIERTRDDAVCAPLVAQGFMDVAERYSWDVVLPQYEAVLRSKNAFVVPSPGMAGRG